MLLQWFAYSCAHVMSRGLLCIFCIHYVIRRIIVYGNMLCKKVVFRNEKLLCIMEIVWGCWVMWLVYFACVPSQYYTALWSWQNGNCFVYYYLVAQSCYTSLKNSMIFVGFACFAHFDRKCYFDWNCCFGRNCRWVV